jgi:hypothetical protein
VRRRREIESVIQRRDESASREAMQFEAPVVPHTLVDEPRGRVRRAVVQNETAKIFQGLCANRIETLDDRGRCISNGQENVDA